eukprot:g33918.t1
MNVKDHQSKKGGNVKEHKLVQFKVMSKTKPVEKQGSKCHDRESGGLQDGTDQPPNTHTKQKRAACPLSAERRGQLQEQNGRNNGLEALEHSVLLELFGLCTVSFKPISVLVKSSELTLIANKRMLLPLAFLAFFRAAFSTFAFVAAPRGGPVQLPA